MGSKSGTLSGSVHGRRYDSRRHQGRWPLLLAGLLAVLVGFPHLMLGQVIPGRRPPAEPRFYVYEDASSSNNHYEPTGYMGDVGDIRIVKNYEKNPHSGPESLQIVYSAKGTGPSECPYRGPCKWAGVYWQQPTNNWGKDQVSKAKGWDLSSYNRLLFAARAEKPATIEFKVGGIDAPYGDSLKDGRRKVAKLTEAWQEFEIDLTGADLRHIIGGFSWVTNWDTNPQGVTFYLDDVRFERR